MRRRLGNVPIVAEDLGLLIPQVEALRDRLGFPGMRVLQFAFDGSFDNPHLPANYPKNVVAYTGTHDNDTTSAGSAPPLLRHEKMPFAPRGEHQRRSPGTW
jgi:4-alpha-glucanotransferase